MRRVRGQGGVRDGEEPVTRTCSPSSHQDAAKSEIWLFSPFDPGNKAPAGGLRICPLPMCPLPRLQSITDLYPCE